jgi:hypothetical protein
VRGGALPTAPPRIERSKEGAMRTPGTTQPYQWQLARFLEEHPSFSPFLKGADAAVSGFQVGKCFLTLDEMERLISTPVDMQLAAQLRTAPSGMSKRRMP